MIIVLICIFLPLFETIEDSGPLWGMNYDSPLFMAYVGDLVRIIKLIIVGFGIYILATKGKTILQCSPARYHAFKFIVSAYILAIGLFLVLFGGNLYYGMATDNEPHHYEKVIDKHSYYVFTPYGKPDPDAKQVIYLKCALALNRYELKKIGEIEPLKDFNLEVQNHNLIMSSVYRYGSVTRGYKLPLDGISCS
jgi:hypothetical protein